MRESGGGSDSAIRSVRVSASASGIVRRSVIRNMRVSRGRSRSVSRSGSSSRIQSRSQSVSRSGNDSGSGTMSRSVSGSVSRRWADRDGPGPGGSGVLERTRLGLVLNIN